MSDPSAKLAAPVGSSSSSSSKRASLAPAPKALTAIHPSAIISNHAHLSGPYRITIAPNAVLHPHCKITAMSGPIYISEGAMVAEGALVGAGPNTSSSTPTSPSSASAGMPDEGSIRIGKNTVIESKVVLGPDVHIGDGTIIEAGARLATGTRIGSFCTVAAASSLGPFTQLPDYAVVYDASTGPGATPILQPQFRIDTTMRDRQDIRNARLAMHERHLDVCRKLIPSNVAKWQ